MKGAILEKQEMYYTYMDVIFESMDIMGGDFNWLITDYECNRYIDPIIFDNTNNYVWISGDKLYKFLRENKIQFIWGSFTAFEKNIDINEILKYDLPPSANGFFGNDRIEMRHPLSVVEIVAADSSYVYVVSKDNYYIQKFLDWFPLAENLDTFFER